MCGLLAAEKLTQTGHALTVSQKVLPILGDRLSRHLTLPVHSFQRVCVCLCKLVNLSALAFFHQGKGKLCSACKRRPQRTTRMEVRGS